MGDNVPAFIDILPEQQVEELRLFLKSKGADISEESAGDSVEDVNQIIEATDVLWRDGKEGGTDVEIESVNNAVIFLMLLIQENKGLISSFCDKLSQGEIGDKRNGLRLKLLNNLFSGLNEENAQRYIVYMALLKLASRADLLPVVKPNIDEIKRWLAMWKVSTICVQALWRTLHEAYRNNKQTELATKVMIELLGTYTSDNASQAREDAHKCIVTCLADPETFIMDHLLTLKPVKVLEGELLHNLLTIFVTGKLSHYLQFYEDNKDFVNALGLSHEDNIKKMKLLTFMQMAETRQEIDYETIQREIGLDQEDIESFIIDVVRTKAVFAKIDQLQRRVLISYTTHRTFGKQQWQLLREQLSSWQQNLEQCLTSLQSLTPHH